jgi:hypothetical protein
LISCVFVALSKICLAKIYIRKFVSASEDKGQVLIKPGKERRELEQSESVGTDHQEGKGSKGQPEATCTNPNGNSQGRPGRLKKQKRKWKQIQSQQGGSQE